MSKGAAQTAQAPTGYVFEAHKPRKQRGVPWPVCAGCGLVYLHNDVTAWCVRMGCNATDHPGWRTLRSTLGGPWP